MIKSAQSPVTDIMRCCFTAGFCMSTISSRAQWTDPRVTAESCFDWLVGQAREQKSDYFELDSGVQRFDAHRFYFLKRMKIATFRCSCVDRRSAVSGALRHLYLALTRASARASRF